MKLDRKQDLNVIYHVCIMQADQETKMAALANSSKKGGTLYSGARYVALWASCFFKGEIELFKTSTVSWLKANSLEYMYFDCTTHN